MNIRDFMKTKPPNSLCAAILKDVEQGMMERRNPHVMVRHVLQELILPQRTLANFHASVTVLEQNVELIREMQEIL